MAQHDNFSPVVVDAFGIAEAYAKEHFTKAVKKTLTIPKWLNDAAIAKKLNFSKILQDALKHELNIG